MATKQKACPACGNTEINSKMSKCPNCGAKLSKPIYKKWWFWDGNNKHVNKLSKSLANAVKEISGYPLDEGSSVAGAGYKDWAIDELRIPSITVEIGCGVSPLAERELYSIFMRNFRILPSVARWLQMQ